MSEFRIVSRLEMGLPELVTRANGTPRPPLHGAYWLTNHYTGNNVLYATRDWKEVVRQIQRIFTPTKPFQYNYAIGQADDNEIGEFAGKFVAVHSAGENHGAFGVIFINGIGEPLTPLQIRKYQWLRDVLTYDGSLSTAIVELPHHAMPGAKTACSGTSIAVPTVQEQLRQKYTQPVGPISVSPPITLIPEEVNTMQGILYIIEPTFPGKVDTTAWLIKYADGHLERAFGSTIRAAKLLGLPIVPEDSHEHYTEQLNRISEIPKIARVA